MQLPRPGEILEGKYRLEEMLGEGAFGLVVKGTTLSTNRPVAVKILKPTDEGYKDSRAQRFMRELRVIAKLQCPNTLTLYDFGRTDDGILFMVTEYVEGEDLFDLLKRQRKLPEKQVMHILHQCLLSLSEAHEHTVLHRDIKPHNIRLTTYGDDPLRVKVLDFGLSKTLEDDRGSTLTAAGIAVGTPRYMSPEQLSGKDLGPATDIYSLGLCAYEMLLGEPATPLDSVVGPRRKVEIDPSSEVTDHLRELVNNMLKRSRRERYKTASEVLAALKAVRNGQAPPPPGGLPGFAPRSGRHSAVSSTGKQSAYTGERRSLESRTKGRSGSNRGYLVAGGALVAIAALAIAGAMILMPDDQPTDVELGTRRTGITKTEDHQKGQDEAAEIDQRDETPEQAAPAKFEDHSCSGLHAFEPGIHQLERVAGLTKEKVWVYIPKDYDPTKPHPTIWALHDFYSTSEDLLRHMNHDSVKDLESFIIVAPQADKMTAWLSPEEFHKAASELDLAREQLCVDNDRFYVWGVGFGGRVATRNAMCMNGVAAVATTAYRERHLSKLCNPEQPVPYLHVGVTRDPASPGPEAGKPGCWEMFIGRAPPIEEVEDYFQRRHGCSGDQRQRRTLGDGECYTWKCDVPFSSCVVDGGRPLPRPMPMRTQMCKSEPADFPYVRTVFEFFSQFSSRPSRPD